MATFMVYISTKGGMKSIIFHVISAQSSGRPIPIVTKSN